MINIYALRDAGALARRQVWHKCAAWARAADVMDVIAIVWTTDMLFFVCLHQIAGESEVFRHNNSFYLLYFGNIFEFCISELNLYYYLKILMYIYQNYGHFRSYAKYLHFTLHSRSQTWSNPSSTEKTTA